MPLLHDGEKSSGLLSPPGRAATNTAEPLLSEKREQVSRVLASLAFRNSPLLQQFLKFVTDAVETGRDDEISEYRIATAVFGRPTDFDPALDTIVRTQAYRLRNKLAEHYAKDGRNDPIRIDIPKGHYIPHYHRLDEERSAELPHPAVIEPAKPIPQRAGWKVRPWLGATIALAIFAAGLLLGGKFIPSGRTRPGLESPPRVLQTFWTAVLGREQSVILAYTNSVFLETNDGDLLRFRNGAVADRGARVTDDQAHRSAVTPQLLSQAGPLFYEDGYTGTGEVVAAERLANLFTRLGIETRVKRSRLITIDDLQSHTIVFLGSPFENEVLTNLGLPWQFVFDVSPGPPYLWEGHIVAKQPRNGESRAYAVERDPTTQVIRADYAVVGVLPGITAGHKIVVLAGLTTSGTEGAAEYITSASSVAELGLRLSEKSDQHRFPTYFQCILRVQATKGLDAMKMQFVTSRFIQSDN